jgi:hypothetical protein
MSIRLRAKCVREIYHNDNFYILGFVPVGSNREIQLNQYGNFTCSGEIGFISVNKEYELVVQEKNGSKYGVTYEILEVPSMVMEDLSSLSYQQKFEILMECTTSERIAKNILEGEPNYIELAVTKGEDSIDVSKIRGVAKKLNHVYCKQLIKKYKYYAFCQNANVKEYELNITDAKKMFDEYSTQDKILSELQSNPYYALIEVLGRSFERTDKLLMNVRSDLKTSNTRCEALIIDVLKKNEMEGSSRLNGSILYQVVRDDYSCPELIPMLKTVSESSDMIYFDQKSGDLSIMATYLAECEIADFIMSKNKNSHVLDIDWTKYTKFDDGTEMTDSQSEILRLFCNYDVMCLCGYSGTGKTTSVKGLINLMEDNGITYTLLSTTGKAGKVLSESTNRKASTIHRACYSGVINTDCVIVDEYSMCSLDVMIMLLHSIENPNIKIVFVFDSAQLPSIGVSKLGDDMLNSNVVPKIVLTEVFRYTDNGSLFVATNIRQGKNFLDNKDMVKCNENVYSVSSNYKFINVMSEEEIFEEVISQYDKLLKSGTKQDDILVLSPMNVGSCGTYAINNAIQREYNPPLPNEKVHTRKINNFTITFRTNDLVVNKKNDYNVPTYDGYLEMQSDDRLEEDDVDTTMVLNGQIGRIVEVIDKGLLIKFDEEIVYFNKTKINNLLLAYSISEHSAQGSTCQRSIGIVSNTHKRMLSKALLYVGDTRCRKSHIDIGQVDAFEYALTVDDNKLRNTWLKELLMNWNNTLDKAC